MCVAGPPDARGHAERGGGLRGAEGARGGAVLRRQLGTLFVCGDGV